jgi:hypothetical protein
MGKNDNRRGLKMRQRIRQSKLKVRLARRTADAKAAGIAAKAAAAPPPPKAAEKAPAKKSRKKAAPEAASE